MGDDVKWCVSAVMGCPVVHLELRAVRWYILTNLRNPTRALSCQNVSVVSRRNKKACSVLLLVSDIILVSDNTIIS